MRCVLLMALCLASGAALADASDDYLQGLRALEAGQTSRGMYLLEQAALAGLVDAQLRFGELTPGQAGDRWLRSAVREGSLPAAEILAQRYYDQAEYRRAAQCWLLAASQGRSEAQARLGALQVVGYGLPRDLVQAYAWLNLAASAGDADVIALRDKLGEQLDPAQIVSGEALSRELPQKLPQLLGEPPCGE